MKLEERGPQDWPSIELLKNAAAAKAEGQTYTAAAFRALAAAIDALARCNTEREILERSCNQLQAQGEKLDAEAQKYANLANELEGRLSESVDKDEFWRQNDQLGKALHQAIADNHRWSEAGKVSAAAKRESEIRPTPRTLAAMAEAEQLRSHAVGQVTASVRQAQHDAPRWSDPMHAAWFKWQGTPEYAVLLCDVPIQARPAALRWAQSAFAASQTVLSQGTIQSESERDAATAEQARRAMPLIGPLLDAWEGIPNDEKPDALAAHVAALDDAMELRCHAQGTGNGR